jgi:hypothetical protein
VEGRDDLELERPRGAFQLVGTTFDLYWRFPLLFLILAAAVVVPYELIVLAATGTSSLDRSNLGFIASNLLFLVDLALVTGLISALHIHAVDDVREGRRPQLRSVARRGLTALPVVAVVVVLTWFGTLLGFVALIVPGVLLLARWSVAAQAAALRGRDWEGALEWSKELADGEYPHVFGVLILVGAITFIPSVALSLGVGHKHTTAASFLADLALQIVVRSFTALATALLYFDLKARRGAVSADRSAAAAVQSDERTPGWYVDPGNPRRMRYWNADGKGTWSKTTAKTPKPVLREWKEGARGPEEEEGEGKGDGHALDPGVYSDEDRPPGWYVNPDAPWRMRYWNAEGEPGWSGKTTKTPKQVLANWRDLRWQQRRV